jgi:RimJ/RimL family protein N-acetyltransferase
VLVQPPDPPLRAGAVLLRPFNDGDASAVAEACQDIDIPRFTFMKEGLTEDEARDWIRLSNERWADGRPRFAIVSDDDRLLGQIGMAISDRYVSAEAYYWIASRTRRAGIASTALGLLADWAFDQLGIERLYLLTHPENQASQRLALHCGFTREGVLRAYEPFKGTRPDMVCLSLLPGDRRPWRDSSPGFTEGGGNSNVVNR